MDCEKSSSTCSMPYSLIVASESGDKLQTVSRKIQIDTSSHYFSSGYGQNQNDYSENQNSSAQHTTDNTSFQHSLRTADQTVPEDLEQVEKQQQQEHRGLPQLPVDIISQILSYCNASTQRGTSLTSRRMHALVAEYQESIAKISFQNERAELSNMYPNSTQPFPTAVKRNAFFDRLQIQEDETLSYFDKAQVTLAPVVDSEKMEWLSINVDHLDCHTEHKTTSIDHRAVKTCNGRPEVFLLAYDLYWECWKWRRWVVRAIRLVQCIFVSRDTHPSTVFRFVREAPLMSILAIRFMSVFMERVNKLRTYRDGEFELMVDDNSFASRHPSPDYLDPLLTHEQRRCWQLGFEDWMLSLGQTYVGSAKSVLDIRLFARVIRSDNNRIAVGTASSNPGEQLRAIIPGTSDLVVSEDIELEEVELVRFDRMITQRIKDAYGREAIAFDAVELYVELERLDADGDFDHVSRHAKATSTTSLERCKSTTELGAWVHGMGDGHRRFIKSWYEQPNPSSPRRYSFQDHYYPVIFTSPRLLRA